MKPHLLLLAILSLPLPAFGQPAPDPLRSMMAADLAWADSAARGGVDGYVWGLTDDVLYLHPGAPVMRGRATVRAFLAAQPAQPGSLVGWQPVRGQVSADGSVGYTLGFTAQSEPSSPGTAPALRFGRYLTYWRRGADGGWKAAATVTGIPATPGAPAFPAEWTAGFRPDTGQGGARAAMERADRAFSDDAVRNGTAHAFEAFAAPDAVTFFGELQLGPREIGAVFAGSKARYVWRPAASGAAAAGDLGFTVGEAELTATGRDGTARTTLTKYLTIWRRQSDGSYRYVTDAGNGRPAPR